MKGNHHSILQQPQAHSCSPFLCAYSWNSFSLWADLMLCFCLYMPHSLKWFQVKLSIEQDCHNAWTTSLVTQWHHCCPMSSKGCNTGSSLPNPTCHIRRDHSKTRRATRRNLTLDPPKHADIETDQTQFPNHAHHDHLLSSKKAPIPFLPNCPQSKTLHPEAQTLAHQAEFFSNTRTCTK